MKKRATTILLALVMALTLLPVTAFAADFTGWTELRSGNYNLGSGKYYLNGDVSMNELFRTQDNADVTIDLNGHVLDAKWGVRVGLYGSLTILDSAPNALHTGSNAELPAGGVIRCTSDNFDIGWDNSGTKYPATCYLNGGTILSSRVNIMSGGKLYMNALAHIKGGTVHLIASDYAPATTLYANGGVIDGEVSGYGIIENTASTVTSFYGGAAYNVKIKGGLFYGADLDGTKDGTTVTYNSDGATYATQILPANGKAAEPDAPKKDGCIFTGWLRADGTSFEFNTPITENTTLTAGWFDPADAGGKGDKGDAGVTPQLKIGTDNLWYVSYDNGATWTSLGVEATGGTGPKGDTGATGAQGEKGDKGDKGDTGTAGKDGVTPLLLIGTDNNWYISYDNAATWTSLGVAATGPKGDKGDTGATGALGA